MHQTHETLLLSHPASTTPPSVALLVYSIDSNFTVKVGDGALTYDLYPDFYHAVYGVRRPVRWAALETLTQGICEVKSNVVS